MAKLAVSAIIPVKDEAHTLREIIRAVKKMTEEVLVIEGKSGDASRQIAEEEGAVVYQDPGKGKGVALRLGIEKAKGDVLVFIDADGSHDPEDIPKLLKPIEDNEADLVIASRHKGGSEDYEGHASRFLRILGNALICFVINLRWEQQITDAVNGFRAIRVDLAKSLELKENSSIELEMLAKTLRKGRRVKEVPSHEYKRVYGESHFIMRRVGLRFLMSLIRNCL